MSIRLLVRPCRLVNYNTNTDRRSAEKENSLDFDVDVVDISGDTGRFKVNNFKWFDDNVYFDIYQFFRLLFFIQFLHFLWVNAWFFPSASEQCRQVIKVT